MDYRTVFTAIFLAILPFSTGAIESVTVQALFPGKAMLTIDGQSRVLKTGETSPEGVKLVAADSKKATLEINGQTKDYLPGSAISLNFIQPESIEEQVFADERGMFLKVGSINGRPVKFLVDTGATVIAMNKKQAKSLGISYRIDGEPATASTASSFVRSYRVRLKSVSLGKIRRRNVEAMIIDGNHPGPILLGMSFLKGLKIDKKGNAMVLKQKK